ncbi:MAG: Hsp20/alpha crystallin family protein [Oscillospiraceae bacterium]|nr:Hsp20/alpha crystallin family protein [Oscillospiraceae bacterium]
MFELTPFIRTRAMDTFNPFRELADLERRFFSGNMGTDIRDNGDSYVLETDLPGVRKEDIHIDIDGDRLSISAQRSSHAEEKDSDGNYIRCERSTGAFSRSFDISGVRSEDISAGYENGVLTLTMPKKEAAVPVSRRLEIQ